MKLKKVVFYFVIIVLLYGCGTTKKFHHGMFMHNFGGKREYTKITNSDVNKMVFKKQGVKVNDMFSIRNIVRSSDSKIYFIGEIHDNFAHHYNQLNFIKELHEKYGKMAIGMEMFQVPFQSVLDDYVSGKINEIEMLEKTEYFDRWRFDYKLYKPILDYAKNNKIKIIALNAPKEATDNISKTGLDNLTDRKFIASEFDFTNKKYEAFLKEIFKRHKSSSVFKFFYQVQLTWDETMAETAAKYAEEHPDEALVIIAGNGHLRYGYGIPDRFKKRTGLDFVVVLQDEELKSNIADYVLFPEIFFLKPTMKLGVVIDKKENGLEVADVIPGGLADKFEVKKKDIIINIDGKKITDIADLKLKLYELDGKKKFNITVKRKDREKVIEVNKDK